MALWKFFESLNCKSNTTSQCLEEFFRFALPESFRSLNCLGNQVKLRYTWKPEVRWWDTVLGLVSYFALQEELSYFAQRRQSQIPWKWILEKPIKQDPKPTSTTTMKGERMQINSWTDSSELVFSVDNTEFVVFFHIISICLVNTLSWTFFCSRIECLQ